MTGSARPLIAWAAFLLTFLCVVGAVVSMRANGLLVLALLFTVVFTWAIGGFTRGFWSR